MAGQQAQGRYGRTGQVRQRAYGQAGGVCGCLQGVGQGGVADKAAATDPDAGGGVRAGRQGFGTALGDALGGGLRCAEVHRAQGLGRNQRAVAAVGLAVHQVAAGVGQHPDGRAVKHAPIHSQGGGQGLQVVQARQPHLPRAAQGRGRGQHQADAGKRAWPAHAGQAAKIRQAQIQGGADMAQGRGQNFRGSFWAAPFLGAEQGFVLRHHHLQRAFGGVEDEFQAGARGHEPLPNQPVFLRMRQTSL